MRLVAVTLSGFAALLLAGCAAAGASVGITASNGQYAYGPASVFVKLGQDVTWTNSSDAPHNVTSDGGSELESPDFNAGGTFSHTFRATGSFPYHCTIHTYMKGTVVVLPPGATPPS